MAVSYFSSGTPNDRKMMIATTRRAVEAITTTARETPSGGVDELGLRRREVTPPSQKVFQSAG
jgi:hypothetical protein